jgi:O-6-methylguanine DNA methyltransferase
MRSRKYAPYWHWKDKQLLELGVVREWIALMPDAYHSVSAGPHPNQAPDCIILDGGNNSVGVEVVELVDSFAVAKNEQGEDIYRHYKKGDFVAAVRDILKNKDAKTYFGRYLKIIVLIHTDEPDLSYERCREWLKDAEFPPLDTIDEAFIIFPYNPVNKHQYIRIKVNMKSFKEKVFEVVRRIPAGTTLTYKQVAEKAGRPRAYRAVGNILHTNYDPGIPCHRVVRSDGKPGGYNRGCEEKRRKLKEEGAS